MANHVGLWGECPGPRDGRPPKSKCVPVWRPTWERQVSGRVVCGYHCVVSIHWHERRPYVCTAPLGRCPRCTAGQGTKWEAWLAVQPADSPGWRLVPVTAGAARHSKAPHFNDDSVSWLGWRVQLVRLGTGKTAPVRLWCEPPRPDAPPLPAAPDLASWVRHLYSVASPGEEGREGVAMD